MRLAVGRDTEQGSKGAHSGVCENLALVSTLAKFLPKSCRQQFEAPASPPRRPSGTEDDKMCKTNGCSVRSRRLGGVSGVWRRNPSDQEKSRKAHRQERIRRWTVRVGRKKFSSLADSPLVQSPSLYSECERS